MNSCPESSLCADTSLSLLQFDLDSSHISTPQRPRPATSQRPRSTQLTSLVCGVAVGRCIPLPIWATSALVLLVLVVWASTKIATIRNANLEESKDDGISLLHVVQLTPQRPRPPLPLRSVDEQFSYRPYGSPWRN